MWRRLAQGHTIQNRQRGVRSQVSLSHPPCPKEPPVGRGNAQRNMEVLMLEACLPWGIFLLGQGDILEHAHIDHNSP